MKDVFGLIYNLADSIDSMAHILLPLLFSVMILLVQMRTQFEHKVKYEAWKNLSQRIFDLSFSLAEFEGRVSSLQTLRKYQENPIFNRGDKRKYRIDVWDQLQKSYFDVTDSYISFLQSYEANQYLFLDLDTMKTEFQKEYGEYFEVLKYDEFAAQVFPEIYGNTNELQESEYETLINDYWQGVVGVHIFLSEDMRIEFQNHTVAKIMRRRIPARRPDSGFRVLTKKGFIKQR
ncbi:MAG: hypothetical protein HGB37_02875 [Candidatus Moranbacteria bacterium]|nr:hypothetical protein [Candidatus Moranbacteria bacterium]NTW89823.1 hypothetical protein [Candidatus Moranbacteria bacterium]